MYKDYYSILGIPKDATSQEIKKTYRALAMKYHPDRNRDDPSCAESFKEITEAYGVLIDPDKRITYDRQHPHAFTRQKVFSDIFSRSEFRDGFEGLPSGRSGSRRCGHRQGHRLRGARGGAPRPAPS
jgi:DnaJ-class molecular chaperone